jgi:hypothetical protein
MRDVINKNITEQDVMNSCSVAFEEGWSAMKMYFMIGLPTETDDDVTGIAELGKKVANSRKGRLTRESRSPVRPPTSFLSRTPSVVPAGRINRQIEAACSRAWPPLSHRRQDLSAGPLCSEASSRAATRLCNVARGHGWAADSTAGPSISSSTNGWALRAEASTSRCTGIPGEGVRQAGSAAGSAPWDHIDTLVKRKFNAREYIKGIKAKISPPASCH